MSLKDYNYFFFLHRLREYGIGTLKSEGGVGPCKVYRHWSLTLVGQMWSIPTSFHAHSPIIEEISSISLVIKWSYFWGGKIKHPCFPHLNFEGKLYLFNFDETTLPLNLDTSPNTSVLCEGSSKAAVFKVRLKVRMTSNITQGPCLCDTK